MISGEDEAKALVSNLAGSDTAAMARLEQLAAMLAIENERQNLVAAASLSSVWQRHIADSAQLLSYVPRETGLWLDLGTGAGFPGLVVAALRPELQVTMVESRPKRVAWLNFACSQLDLSKAVIIGNRLEAVPDGKFDVISARAFAPLARLIDLSSRFSTSATTWVLPKGRSAAQELASFYGWENTFHVKPSMTDSEAGIVVGNLIGPKGTRS